MHHGDPSDRPSLQSRFVVALMRATVRPVFSRLPATPTGVRLLRHASRARLPIGRPTAARVEPVCRVVDGHEIVGEWVCWPTANADEAVLYLHGSAFVASGPRTHRGLAAQISRAARMPVFMLDYRLAPEHPFPAAVDDTLAAYRWLRAQPGVDRVVVMGDSAGGHLAIDMALQAARRGLALPTALALFSPLIQVDFPGAEQVDRSVKDPLSNAAGARRLMRIYSGDRDPRDPRLDLLNNDLAGLPPTLIQVGELEMLRDQAERFTAQARRCGVSVDLQVWRGQCHVFQSLVGIVPEARRALIVAGDWVRGTADAAAERQQGTGEARSA